MKIRKGDKVQVISGAYKGTVADVTRVLPKENKVVVEGVNIIKKHMKPTQQDPDGKIIERGTHEDLIKNKGVVVSRDKLLSKVWGFEYEGETRTVDAHVKTLRQKLGEAGSCIKTVRNVGYMVE